MYDKDFLCTYKLQPADLQDRLYQIQLLQAFDLETWDDDKVNKTTQTLFSELREVPELKKCINKIKTHEDVVNITALTGQDMSDILLFRLLFQFDYFDLIHKCICQPTTQNFSTLLEEINNNDTSTD